MKRYDKDLTVKQKALRINLDSKIYGSFAEIGAGQDVAAHFFKAGGASGTIAKTISAYDMTFSDTIYGPEETKRYVTESRLIKMLNREYRLVVERLAEQRADDSLFFAFADTVVALNFNKTNQGHGWLGLRFQLKPHGEYNEIVLHLRLHDNDSLLQQHAIGVVGVNLIYGCFYYYEQPEILLKSLMDDLSRDRVEIDMIRFEGPDFEHVDNRLMSLKLVLNGFTEAALFGPDGQNMLAADMFYKKNIAVIRGRFRPVTHVFEDMLTKGTKHFLADPEVDTERTLVISELTLSNLMAGDTGVNEKDFLDRVDLLCALGQTVLISNFHEYYKLVAFLSLRTPNKLGIILGTPNMDFIFEEEHYSNLPGGILEGFATLFSRRVKLYVYPTIKNGVLYTCQNLDIKPHLKPLFEYLNITNKLEDIEDANLELLKIISDNVLADIREDKPGWEANVPPQVAEMIKKFCLFGYPCAVDNPQAKIMHVLP
jgi:hypothetical protein